MIEALPTSLTMSTASHEIAVEAARLVVDEGMEYAAAKRKAARTLGRRGGRSDLPSNEEIEDEVRVHIEIFHGDTQPIELQALRGLALRWMQRLQAFRPHLGGAVWRGAATHLSAVFIDLYCDDPKSAEIELLNQGIPFDLGPQQQGVDDPVSVLTIGERCPGIDGLVSLHLIVNDLDGLRGALKPDARGRTWRGDIGALQRLLTDAAP
jgi:hypothetical protein